MVKKIIAFVCILSLIVNIIPSSLWAMEEDIEGESSRPPKGVRRHSQNRPKEKEKEKEYEDLSSLIKDPKHQIRKRLNQSLLIIGTNNPSIEKANSFETSIIIYKFSNKKKTEPVWDDHPLFLKDLDERFFNIKCCKKTRFLEVCGALLGSFSPVGMAPLVLYLAQNVWFFLPINSVASYTLVGSVMGITVPAASSQMGGRMQIIGNSLFDKNGFSPSKEDKKPHIHELDVEKEIKFRKKSYYISIPFETLAQIFGFFNGVSRSAPIAVFFWQAEHPFPLFAELLIGPLALMYFEQEYKKSMNFLTRLVYKRKTDQQHMVVEKKQILTERLQLMKKFINGKKSDNLVNTLYSSIQDQLRKNNSTEDDQEQISAFSALLLKKITAGTLTELQNELGEQTENSSKELEPLLRTVQGLPLQEMSNSIETIDNLSSKSNMRILLEKLSIFSQGAASIGWGLVAHWAASQIFMYLGYDSTSSVYVAVLPAAVEVLCRTAREWYIQQDTFSSVRYMGSRAIDFWPFRWAGDILSALGALFFTSAPVGIIFETLGDAPLYLKVLISAAIVPSEFSSFFAFFREKYAKLITKTVTLKVKTTRQKRAWLNEQIDRAIALVEKLDKFSTEQLAHLTQDML